MADTPEAFADSIRPFSGDAVMLDLRESSSSGNWAVAADESDDEGENHEYDTDIPRSDPDGRERARRIAMEIAQFLRGRSIPVYLAWDAADRREWRRLRRGG